MVSIKKIILILLAIPVALLIGGGAIGILAGGEAIFRGLIFLVIGVIGAILINSEYKKC